MLRKNITYRDFDGNNVVEEYCFYMMESDFIDLDFKYEEHGGLREYLKNLVKDIQEKGEKAPKRPMYEFLKEMISVSVGRKVGTRFDRSEEVKNSFFQTGAYSAFLMELLNNPNGIPEFLDAITPDIPEAQRKAALEELKNEGIDVSEVASKG